MFMLTHRNTNYIGIDISRDGQALLAIGQPRLWLFCLSGSNHST